MSGSLVKRHVRYQRRPRGSISVHWMLGSIVPGIVAAQEDRPPGEWLLRLGLIATVLPSLFAHRLSASPGIKLYAQQIAHLDATAPKYEAAPNRPTA